MCEHDDKVTITYRIVKGEVTNVKITAITTNMENTLVSRIPADSPTFSTISSTKLKNTQHTAILLSNTANSPFAAHQHPNSTTFAGIESHQAGSNSASKELAKESDKDDKEGIPPRGAITQKTKVSLET